MANPSGSKGAKFEISLLPLLEQYLEDPYRLKNQGRYDKGDFRIKDPRYALEAKHWATYAGHLSTWLGEAEVEAANAGKPHGLVVFKRKGTTDPRKQYCLTTLGSQLELLHGEPA